MANGGYNTTEIIPIQYSNLVTLVTNSKLVPGQQYRITDYITTTTQSDTQSANHAFDIIVTADDVNKLNENARAIQHSGDTYFNGQNLNAWQLKYSLTNDTDHFAWADTTNGKGVIYWMKDEYDNECGYDFKNIQMKYYKITATTTTSTGLVNTYSASREVGLSNGALVPSRCTIDSSDYEWRYTFDLFTNNTHQDSSLNNYSSNNAKCCYNNKINDLYDRWSPISATTRKQRFINIISFRNTVPIDNCYDNTFGTRNYNFSFGDGCYSNSFGNGCYSNSFGNGCYSNSFGNRCYSNTFGSECDANTFGYSCYSNTFGNRYYFNSFDNNCDSNTFGNNCYFNIFGNNCYFNIFGNNFDSNTFGSGCNSNTFGSGCNSNTFGNVCNANIFGNNCKGNNIPTTSGAAEYDEGTSFKSPKFNFAYGDSDNGFAYSGSANTDDEDNPRIYVEIYAFNNGDFDISVNIPYEFSGDISAKSSSSLSGTYSLTIPANESAHFEISAIVSSVEEAENSWEFDAECNYTLGATIIHYTGHYEY